MVIPLATVPPQNTTSTTLAVAPTAPRKFKIGIPRALPFYRFYPFWKTLLEELGAEIVLTPPTSKKIAEEGCAMGFGELCLPMKIFYGHFMRLLHDHQDLDYIFVPRYVSIRPDGYFCPKFLCLPDVAKIIPNAPPILEMEVNVKSHPTITAVTELAQKLGKGSREAAAAYKKATAAFLAFHEAVQAGMYYGDVLKRVEKNLPLTVPQKQETPEVRLLLLGHGYNVFDVYVNLDFYKKLKKQDCSVITLENLPHEVFKLPVIINKSLRNYWTHEEEILAAARYFLTKGRKEIDGVIFLISFACGPDSLMSELIMRDMKVVNLPFLALIIDEHSGEAGILTRIESFVDMIKRKKRVLAAKSASTVVQAAVKPTGVEMNL
jgi:predicted nucleotide-binding protein (sugar kinase/HSP70/actin superfamily)